MYVFLPVEGLRVCHCWTVSVQCENPRGPIAGLVLMFIHAFVGRALHWALDMGPMQVLGNLRSILPVIVPPDARSITGH